MVHEPAESTLIVTPSGETQLPWVAGAVDVALVVVTWLVDGVGDGDGLELGEGDGLGVGVGDELVARVETVAVGEGLDLHALHGLPASAGCASATVPISAETAAAQAMATRRADTNSQIGRIPASFSPSLLVEWRQRIGRAARHCDGDSPCTRLNARLNASSAS